MRALNSRRPRPAASLILGVRSQLLLILLASVLLQHEAWARSLPGDVQPESENIVGGQDPLASGAEEKRLSLSDAAEDIVADEAKVEAEEKKPEESAEVKEKVESDAGEKLLAKEPEEKRSIEEGDAEDLKDEDEDGSVAKKRRRNDVLPAGGLAKDGEHIFAEPIEDHTSEKKEGEGIRRFDAQVDADDESEGQKDDGTEPGRKRLIEVEGSELERKEPEEKSAEIVAQEFDGSGTAEEALPAESIPELAPNEKDLEKIANENRQELEALSETKSVTTNDQDELQTELRNLEKIDDAPEDPKIPAAADPQISDAGDSTAPIEGETSRDQRNLNSAQRKSKFKSSTVYLNAEEGTSPDGEQESIVNGQIKKLISIRDDALGSSDNSELLEEAKLLTSPKDIELAVTVEDTEPQSEGSRSQRSSSDGFIKNKFLFESRKEALRLQDQIKDKAFLDYINVRRPGILPNIPKFTEGQLLESLKKITSTKEIDSAGVSYISKLETSRLTERQLEIIRCAERLVEVRQRQTFIQNLTECIRGLSVFNCMRIFVWPILVENVPTSFSQNFENLPIEINIADLFQGNRGKRAGSLNYITPESIVYTILSDALDHHPNDAKLTTFIDPKNGTLQKLLTPGQIQLLQMAERLLPENLRPHYSDTMFSCVRRFEYFSCMRYFAWPMLRQNVPALPSFPSYHSWYPWNVPLDASYYPIIPFPIEEIGELPEVVEADATRRRTKPETVIVNVLRSTLKENQKMPITPSNIDQNLAPYIALIPQTQLQSLYLAEQLLPAQVRSEFVQKTVKCIQDYNYYTCIKYSTWPTMRQYVPGLQDLSQYIPDLSQYVPDSVPSLSDLYGYLPDLSTFTGLFSYLPGGSGSTQAVQVEPADPSELRRQDTTLNESNILEARVTEILTNIRDTSKQSSETPPLFVNGNAIVLTTISERQINILRLAESVLPPTARAAMVTHVLACLQNGKDFMSCTKYIIWPTVRLYTPNLPEFPDAENLRRIASTKDSPQQSQNQERIHSSVEPAVKIASRTPFQNPTSRENMPVISVTGTRFVPIFTELPEVVLLNILRSIEQSSPNVVEPAPTEASKTQQLLDLLTQQQQTIVRITENLLPDSVRPSFLSRMTDCVRNNNFLLCSRDVLWPTLAEYFPRLPNFPNFGILTMPSNNYTAAKPQAEPTPSTEHLAETNVKTGQHLDATVTYTDTRFFPIFSEVPEAVITNILTAIKLSTPNLPQTSPSIRTQELLKYLNDQQYQIVRLAESLLPEAAQPGFISRTLVCVRESYFLDCTRDIIWPTVAQFYPRLPNFPNFGTSQNLPRTNLNAQPALTLSSLPQSNTPAPLNLTNKTPLTLPQLESKIESILKSTLAKESRLEHSYLDISNPLVTGLITSQEAKIMRLTEKGLPDPVRPVYVMRMLDCVRRENFVTCTQHIGWPTLRQYVPNLPDFGTLGGYFPTFGGTFADQSPGPQLPPQIGQYPDAVAGYPVISQVTQGVQYPQVPQYPSNIQVVDSVQQVAQGFPQFGTFPQYVFGGFLKRPDELQLTARRAAQPIPTEVPKQKMAAASVPAITPSVDNDGLVPGYAGQPPGILLDIDKERVRLPGDDHESAAGVPSKTGRSRRSVVDLLKLYSDDYENDDLDDVDNVEQPEKLSGSIDAAPFPNITESELLQLLVNISKTQKAFVGKDSLIEPSKDAVKEYYVDTLNETIRNSLTADQYEILKLAEDLRGPGTVASRGFMQRVVQCVMSLSFIRCMGIFLWPVVQSNLPSLPSFPSIPSFGIFGRATEDEVERYLGMSSYEFEKELIIRKESIEKRLVSWYKKLSENEFQQDIGVFNVRGHGNGEVSISMSGSREGRASKIKDNKNLPSILTIISDIMEEVLDQRPDIDKAKREKEKKDRSVDYQTAKPGRRGRSMDVGMNYQMLPDEEDAKSKEVNEKQKAADDDAEKRSINDEQLISMFLDKIKANNSDFVESDVRQYVNLEDAYNAFGLLFGHPMPYKDPVHLPSSTEDQLTVSAEHNSDRLKEFDVVPLESQARGHLTVLNPAPKKFTENIHILPVETQTHESIERLARTPDETIKEFNIVPLEAQGKEYLRSLVNDDHDHLKRFKILPLEAQVNYDLAKESLEDQKEQSRHDRTKNTYFFFSKTSDVQKSQHSETKKKSEKEDKDDSKKAMKNCGKELTLQLPQLNDEIVPKKMTSAIINFSRGMKVKMSQMMPGVGLVFSFIVQLMLSHARAAASIAGMLSNMALGSAVLGMMRESMFGSNSHPKIKYVYDNEKYAPMITWPYGMHDG